MSDATIKLDPDLVLLEEMLPFLNSVRELTRKLHRDFGQTSLLFRKPRYTCSHVEAELRWGGTPFVEVYLTLDFEIRAQVLVPRKGPWTETSSEELWPSFIKPGLDELLDRQLANLTGAITDLKNDSPVQQET